MSCDPNFTSVSLLLHFDGTNGQTTTSDNSQNAYAVANGGGASLSTASPKFGTASSSFTGVNSTNWYVGNMPGGPLDLRQSVFTVELWLKTSASGQGILWSDYVTGDTEYLRGYINNGYIALQAQYNSGSGGGTEGTVAINDGAWHHVVWEADASGFGIAIDGVWLLTGGYNFSGNPVPGGQSFQIGSDGTSFQGDSYVGNMDELRITKGLLRYPIGTNFTPPTQAFPNTSCTVIVPDVLGLLDTPAQTAITTAGLVVGTVTTVSNAAAPNTVIAQIPAGGVYATAGDAVDITESQGFLVPDLTNVSATVVAPGLITGAGFVLGTVTRVPSVLVIPGNVVSQFPAPGLYEPGGTPIDIAVSTGREAVYVPYITGDTANAANTAIIDIGLVVGAVSFAPSTTVPAGDVISQNPQGGTPVASGVLVSYVISTGAPVVSSSFDARATVISQYANSPTLLQLVDSFAGYVDQSTNFANFYAFVWNVDTAQGFGLDIWGAIVNVSRLLTIPTSARYVGFQDGTGPGTGTDVEPFSQDGSWYVPGAGTEAYLLEDAPYRQLILTKALANIVNTTVPAFNQLLQNLFPGRGNPYVITSGTMAMEFHFDFSLTPIELAILEQSGAVPVPPGVSFTIVTP